MGLKENLRQLEVLRRLLSGTRDDASFGHGVRLARTKRGMTLEALATATGMAKSYLSQIETGYAPPPRDEKVRKIAEALGLESETLLAQAHLSQLPEEVKARMENLTEVFDSAEEVMRALLAATPQGLPSGEPGADTDSAGAGSEKDTVDLDAMHASGLLHQLADWGEKRIETRRAKLRPIPVINKVSAGYPQDFTDLGYPVGIADEYVSVPVELSDPNAFAVRVVGDSMEPRYHEGDIVVFSPAMEVASGDDVFVRFAMTGSPIDGHSTFKRIFFDSPDCIRLQPLNERHAPTLAKPNELAGVFRAAARYEKL